MYKKVASNQADCGFSFVDKSFFDIIVSKKLGPLCDINN